MGRRSRAGQYIGAMCPQTPVSDPPVAGPGPDLELTVVLPVFQEERVLAATLEALVADLERRATRFEIRVVDDGSTDRSPEIASRAAAGDPRIVALRAEENRGKGAAVRIGMLGARGTRCVFMDADLSAPLSELDGILAALDEGFDLAIGSRRAPGAHIERHQPRLRELLGKGFTALTRTVLAPGVDDFTCGLKGFRHEAAHSIFAVSALDGWAFDAELIAIARAQGWSWKQVPVRWHHEEDSKVRVVSAVVGSLRDLARILVRRARGAYRRPSPSPRAAATERTAYGTSERSSEHTAP